MSHLINCWQIQTDCLILPRQFLCPTLFIITQAKHFLLGNVALNILQTYNTYLPLDVLVANHFQKHRRSVGCMFLEWYVLSVFIFVINWVGRHWNTDSFVQEQEFVCVTSNSHIGLCFHSILYNNSCCTLMQYSVKCCCCCWIVNILHTVLFICCLCHCIADISEKQTEIVLTFEHFIAVWTCSQMACAHKCQNGEANCEDKWILLHKQWWHEHRGLMCI